MNSPCVVNTSLSQDIRVVFINLAFISLSEVLAVVTAILVSDWDFLIDLIEFDFFIAINGST